MLTDFLQNYFKMPFREKCEMRSSIFPQAKANKCTGVCYINKRNQEETRNVKTEIIRTGTNPMTK